MSTDAARDRRLGFRVPFDEFTTQYIADKPVRAVATNLSDTGIHLNSIAGVSLPEHSVVAMEFELPGVDESIWACGEVCHEEQDVYFHGTGIRFIGIPELYARMIRDYCVEARRTHLASLLAKVRIH